MLIKIAWRNIWRKRTRSLIIISAVVLGIWALVFICSFEFGFINQRFEDEINHYCSHVQLHHPDFSQNYDIQYQVPAADSTVNAIAKNPDVKAVTKRVVITGMISSPSAASGAKVTGIIPADEKKVTGFQAFVKEGTYFEENKKTPVVIGEKLAAKLKVKLKSKIVLTFADKKGNILAGAFRVSGIYRTVNAKMDEMNVFVKASDLNEIIGPDSGYHEIAVLLKDEDRTEAVAARFKKEFSGLKVETWREISPDLAFINDSINFILEIYIIIIMIGLTFAIVNTMLMTVLERVRELGMLMAIGMNKRRTFLMIMYETITLSFIGCLPGILLGAFTVWYFGRHGIDLSKFSKGLESYGYNSMIYTTLDNITYYQVVVSVFITAIISSIYPALRAIRLKPAEAIRKI